MLFPDPDSPTRPSISPFSTFIFTFLADYRDASEDTKNKKATESSLIKNVVSLENQNTIQNKNAKTNLRTINYDLQLLGT